MTNCERQESSRQLIRRTDAQTADTPASSEGHEKEGGGGPEGGSEGAGSREGDRNGDERRNSGLSKAHKQHASGQSRSRRLCQQSRRGNRKGTVTAPASSSSSTLKSAALATQRTGRTDGQIRRPGSRQMRGKGKERKQSWTEQGRDRAKCSPKRNGPPTYRALLLRPTTAIR
jgi:hypothetical protein